jgi:hypothetical protein
VFRLRFRRRLRLGPLAFNFTSRGLSSVSFKLGPFTWNSRRDGTRVDLPGGFHADTDIGPTRRRRRPRRSA